MVSIITEEKFALAISKGKRWKTSTEILERLNVTIARRNVVSHFLRQWQSHGWVESRSRKFEGGKVKIKSGTPLQEYRLTEAGAVFLKKHQFLARPVNIFPDYV